MTHIPTNKLTNNRGVTLLELVVYLVVSSILLVVAVTAFLGQNSSYNRQDVISEIQQNVRGAVEIMSSDIRFAGTGFDGTSKSPFTNAGPQSIGINIGSDLYDNWVWPDGITSFNGVDKTIYYRLVSGDLQRGFAGLGDPQPGAGQWQTIAENIEELRFQYLRNTGSSWIWNNDGSAFLDDIRAVKIIILGAARESAFNPTEPRTFKPPLEPAINEVTWNPVPGTGYKRMMSLVVQCRNNRG